MSERGRDEERVVVLAPSARDGAVTASLLETAGFEALVIGDTAELLNALDAGAGAALVAEEAFTAEGRQAFAELLARQEPWSDLPVILFTGRGARQARLLTLDALAPFGNVTLLERPVEVITMISAVRAALRSRQRQYAAREALETARRRADEIERMQVQLRYQASLLDALGDAVISTDPDLRVRTWNPAAQAIYGYAAAEAVGHHVDELLRAEYRGVSREEAMRRLTEREVVRLEVVHRTRRGARLDVQASVVALRDAGAGSPARWASCATSRRRGGRRRRCGRRTVRRPRSWPCSRTSCATRWPPSATPSRCWSRRSPGAARPTGRSRSWAGRARSSRGSSTTSST